MEQLTGKPTNLELKVNYYIIFKCKFTTIFLGVYHIIKYKSMNVDWFKKYKYEVRSGYNID